MSSASAHSMFISVYSTSSSDRISPKKCNNRVSLTNHRSFIRLPIRSTIVTATVRFIRLLGLRQWSNRGLQLVEDQDWNQHLLRTLNTRGIFGILKKLKGSVCGRKSQIVRMNGLKCLNPCATLTLKRSYLSVVVDKTLEMSALFEIELSTTHTATVFTLIEEYARLFFDPPVVCPSMRECPSNGKCPSIFYSCRSVSLNFQTLFYFWTNMLYVEWEESRVDLSYKEPTLKRKAACWQKLSDS